VQPLLQLLAQQAEQLELDQLHAEAIRTGNANVNVYAQNFSSGTRPDGGLVDTSLRRNERSP